MKHLILFLVAAGLIGCAPHDEQEHAHEDHGPEVSLYNEHAGLTLPDEMQRELNVQLMAVTHTNAIPESAIIRGAKEDFTYVKEGTNLVRTLLHEVPVGAQVVTNGVKDLWMIELLAIRGGEPCCH